MRDSFSFLANPLNVGSLSEPVSGRCWSRTETLHEVETRICRYQALGFCRGTRVLILFGNKLEFFAELLAVWQLGGCAIPVDTDLTPFELTLLAKIADARFCVVDDSVSQSKVAAIPDTIVLHTGERRHSAGQLVSPEVSPDLDDEALILFTSGSTQRPKGVIHTFGSLRSRLIALRRTLGTQDFCRSLCLLPTHFIQGLMSNSLFPWLSGCDLFVAPSFTSSVIMQLGELIDENRISFVSSVPSMWNLALKISKQPKLQSLRRIHCAAAPLSANLWRQVQRWSALNKVVNAYGTTESGSWIAGELANEIVPVDGLVGHGWGCEIRITDAGGLVDSLSPRHERTGQREGAIWLRTPSLMRGYLDDPVATASVVKEGWFNTGDIGHVDETGRLFVSGRKRDEINKGGIKVQPAEVDNAALQFWATDDVCTFGIADELYGENVAIALVMTERRTEVLLDLCRHLESRLSRHKQPVRWYLLDSLPRSNRGKINREDVRRAIQVQEPVDLTAIARASTNGSSTS